MFSGIIEGVGTVEKLYQAGSNQVMWITSPFDEALEIDQSLSHDGVCLTVEDISGRSYQVTAVQETLAKTSLKHLDKGSLVNLERSLTLNSYVDGHLVQGHVDQIATCTDRQEVGGSWLYQFHFEEAFNHLLVEKGSISINGISLTAFNVEEQNFTVAIVPYTYNHTNLHRVEPGTLVNIEFDLIGKYIQKQVGYYR